MVRDLTGNRVQIRMKRPVDSSRFPDRVKIYLLVGPLVGRPCVTKRYGLTGRVNELDINAQTIVHFLNQCLCQ